MVEEQPLRAAQAARRLEIPTKELLRLVHERKIRYIMVDGIAHVPIDALEEYRSRAS
jgi:excisionase family DNA binding protein